MKEIARLKISGWCQRAKLVGALNDSGYGTRIIEEKDPESPYIGGKIHIVVVYKEESKVKKVKATINRHEVITN